MPDPYELYVYPDYESLSQAAAQRFTSSAAHAIQQNGRFWVAISGGSTPRRMLEILASPPFLHQIPWRQIHFFWCDERCVPPDHPESNFALVQNLLFSRLDPYPPHIYRIKGELEPAQAAAEYARQLANHTQHDHPYPKFDLILLGLGDDGHIASLVPGVIQPEETSQPVIAVQANYQGRPAARVSLTPLVFNAAHQVLFLVSGSSKAQVLASTLAHEHDQQRWPAQRIQPQQGTLIWLVDQAAASRVSFSCSDHEEKSHDI